MQSREKSSTESKVIDTECSKKFGEYLDSYFYFKEPHFSHHKRETNKDKQLKGIDVSIIWNDVDSRQECMNIDEKGSFYWTDSSLNDFVLELFYLDKSQQNSVHPNLRLGWYLQPSNFYIHDNDFESFYYDKDVSDELLDDKFLNKYNVIIPDIELETTHYLFARLQTKDLSFKGKRLSSSEVDSLFSKNKIDSCELFLVNKRFLEGYLNYGGLSKNILMKAGCILHELVTDKRYLHKYGQSKIDSLYNKKISIDELLFNFRDEFNFIRNENKPFAKLKSEVYFYMDSPLVLKEAPILLLVSVKLLKRVLLYADYYYDELGNCYNHVIAHKHNTLLFLVNQTSVKQLENDEESKSNEENSKF